LKSKITAQVLKASETRTKMGRVGRETLSFGKEKMMKFQSLLTNNLPPFPSLLEKAGGDIKLRR
jgi:hypothetical protein